MSYFSDISIKEAEEHGLNEVLAYLLEGDLINGASAGIARQVIDRGTDSLTEKQRFVFDKHIEGEFRTECDVCGCRRSWDEVRDSLFLEHSTCFSCLHTLSKME